MIGSALPTSPVWREGHGHGPYRSAARFVWRPAGRVQVPRAGQRRRGSNVGDARQQHRRQLLGVAEWSTTTLRHRSDRLLADAYSHGRRRRAWGEGGIPTSRTRFCRGPAGWSRTSLPSGTPGTEKASGVLSWPPRMATVSFWVRLHQHHAGQHTAFGGTARPERPECRDQVGDHGLLGRRQSANTGSGLQPHSRWSNHPRDV